MTYVSQAIAALLLLLVAAVPVTTKAADRPELRSVGAVEMGGLMDALFDSFVKVQPDVRKGTPWQHGPDALAIGALMFEQADIAPMIREFQVIELAPYAHQFRGDMMQSPVMAVVAMRSGHSVWIAFNRRPGAPPAANVRNFLEFALSPKGQTVIAGVAGFTPLTAEVARSERAKIAGFVAEPDPALPAYRPEGALAGTIRSLGSDGMKSLMDRWMDEFGTLHPGIHRGERWEHLGTLNGYHALLLGQTDLAPMGRELWPQERKAYKAATGVAAPLEIRVARGGYNTPQRTTAQAIFVHASNPIGQISITQLAGIFDERPSITNWGQLGLTGTWASQPIHLYMPPPVSPNVMSMQISVLSGRNWNAAAKAGSVAETAAALASDSNGIGFGGFEEGGAALKTLAIAATDGAPAITASYQTVSVGRYPLTRYLYIRLNRQPGTPLPPQVRGFLRYILSREGQSAIPTSGYFPLTAREAAEELAKLD